MGPIWGVVMNVKNQRLLWDPICRYCNGCKKPATIMGSYMRVLHWMLKISDYYGILYVGIALNVNNQWFLWDPYASIAYLKMALRKL